MQPGLEEVEAIVSRSRRRQVGIAQWTLDERRQRLRLLSQALLARADELASLLHSECGKTDADAWLADISPTADLCRYWAEEGYRHLLPHKPRLNPLIYPFKSVEVFREPRGVIALITPWNFPVAIPLRTLVPALLAGNAVVWKPSEFATGVAQIVADSCYDAFEDFAVTLVKGD